MKFDWSNNREYDFFLSDFNTIIETHGGQHYRDISRLGNLSLEEQQEIDTYKKENALNNGITYYIIIDARKSDFNFIRNNIINSELSKIIDMDKIDWVKINQSIIENDIYDGVIRLWNDGVHNVSELSRLTKLSNTSIRDALIRNELLLNVKYEEGIKERIKAVEVIKDDNILKTYSSCTECANCSMNDFGVQFDIKSINAVCIGRQRSYKGYFFRFVGDNTPQRMVNKNKKAKVKTIQKDLNGNIINIWDSRSEAARNLGGGKTLANHIGLCCHGYLKSAGGYIWEDADEC